MMSLMSIIRLSELRILSIMRIFRIYEYYEFVLCVCSEYFEYHPGCSPLYSESIIIGILVAPTIIPIKDCEYKEASTNTLNPNPKP